MENGENHPRQFHLKVSIYHLDHISIGAIWETNRGGSHGRKLFDLMTELRRIGTVPANLQNGPILRTPETDIEAAE